MSSSPEISQPSDPGSSPSNLSNPHSKVDSPPSYVKLAMRNMVRKGGKSLFHFALTTIGFLSLLIGIAYLTR
ncbi:MAG: DUF3285 domain-containing protein [Oscillatoriales cyanobacterium RM1_1_9]|nr:DUF3285 domain-containing protein [Oscillatoriales cyanobacterium SM2_3_0]NJO47520.1 DUF3285 domain-containing protein [Oscillatoriales cyanobacterium RM2_1_1]NJO71780.1 DUF3285 domain-containing protein [Oscillatoriales cyanobacterium RM1_1_9]